MSVESSSARKQKILDVFFQKRAIELQTAVTVFKLGSRLGHRSTSVRAVRSCLVHPGTPVDGLTRAPLSRLFTNSGDPLIHTPHPSDANLHPRILFHGCPNLLSFDSTPSLIYPAWSCSFLSQLPTVVSPPVFR